jgi:hypothetical protein
MPGQDAPGGVRLRENRTLVRAVKHGASRRSARFWCTRTTLYSGSWEL